MQEKLNEWAKGALAQVPVLEDSRSADPRTTAEHGAATAVNCVRLRVRAKVLDDRVESTADRERSTEVSRGLQGLFLEGRQFIPYSIQTLPESIFVDINALRAACRKLYQHVEWA